MASARARAGKAWSMAVHKRVYRPLTGAELTPSWSRFLVLPRHAFAGLRGERLLTGYIVLCLVPTLVAAAIIYIYNNPVVQGLLGLDPDPGDRLLQINGEFFYWVLVVQSSMSLLLCAWIGPGLVAPDLANNALPLYLSRPFTRAEYVLGRATTLVALLSLITWVPDLLLFGLQAAQEEGWGGKNLRLLWAITAGGMVWIVVASLLVLAVSAWVKWRIAATGLFCGIFFVTAGLGATLNEAMRTHWGSLFNLGYVVRTIWRDLFDVVAVDRHRRYDWRALTPEVPVGFCWLVAGAIAAFALLLLWRRLQAREVVRG